jgi:intraflagellar transport protein 81
VEPLYIHNLHDIFFQEKRNELQSFAGETVLRGDDFKRYVASLRGKSNDYKKKRAELSDLRSEYGVLTR